jgi:hypothetical protein
MPDILDGGHFVALEAFGLVYSGLDFEKIFSVLRTLVDAGEELIFVEVVDRCEILTDGA